MGENKATDCRPQTTRLTVTSCVFFGLAFFCVASVVALKGFSLSSVPIWVHFRG